MAQVLTRLALPENAADSTAVLAKQASMIGTALSLIPLSGIAFLWFIGVVRDHLHEIEDRFYATLFLGSSLLYLGTMFVAAAIAGGLLAIYSVDAQLLTDSVFTFSRSVMHQITNIYRLRMASVVMTSLGSMLMRSGVMPRWSAIVTIVLAIILMLTISLNVWLKLLFPAWVFMVSMIILVANYRRRARVDVGAADVA